MAGDGKMERDGKSVCLGLSLFPTRHECASQSYTIQITKMVEFISYDFYKKEEILLRSSPSKYSSWGLLAQQE